MPVDQDDIAPPPLQMQRGTDADHARAQYENIGLAFRHPALRKLNVTRVLSLLTLWRHDSANHRVLREITLARRPNSGNMDRPEPSILGNVQCATAENVKKCRYVTPCLQRLPSQSSPLRCRRHRA